MTAETAPKFNAGASGKRPRFARGNPPLTAFSLVEVLLVVLLLAISASSFCLTRYAFQDDGVLVEKEARELARWLTNRFTLSNRSGRPLQLYCLSNSVSDIVKVTWQNPLVEEKYEPFYQCRFVRYQNSVTESLYLPQWNALVPTATLKVSRGRAEYYVIVSQRGRVRTNKKPS
jgi:type II secretory pathway pseudopilin PulG